MPTTKRLFTDETGQALVTAINNIVAAVKPNATEIQMSSSDTTTVATAITNINNKIGTVPSGQTVEDQITTLNSNLTERRYANSASGLTKKEFVTEFLANVYNDTSIPIGVYVPVGKIYSGNDEYIGIAIKISSTAVRLTVFDSSRNMINGTKSGNNVFAAEVIGTNL